MHDLHWLCLLPSLSFPTAIDTYSALENGGEGEGEGEEDGEGGEGDGEKGRLQSLERILKCLENVSITQQCNIFVIKGQLTYTRFKKYSSNFRQILKWWRTCHVQ